MTRNRIYFTAYRKGKRVKVYFDVKKKPKGLLLEDGSFIKIFPHKKPPSYEDLRKAWIEAGLLNKADEKKIDTLEKGLRNLSEHDNIAPKLLQIEKDIRNLKIHHWINFIFLMITIWLFIILGGMLL